MHRRIQITWYLSSLTMHTAVFGTARPSLGSHRNGQEKLYLFQKYLLSLEHENFVSPNKIDLVKVIFFFFYNLFILKAFDTPLHCLKETAQFCEFYDNVFEMDRKRLELRALCFTLDQLASSPPRCEGSSYLKQCFPSAPSLPIPVAEARLLELRVRIPLESWMSVSCECCVLSEVFAGGRSLPRGVLPIVVYHCVWSTNLEHEAALARVGLLRQKQNALSLCCI